MLTDANLKYVAELFNGDRDGLLPYKTGPQLVAFFNSYFGYEDVYSEGFPSRWLYTRDKIRDLDARGELEEFFNVVLDKSYVIREVGLGPVDAAQRVTEVLEKINSRLQSEGYQLIKRGGHYHLTPEEADLDQIGGGGFANVYKQRSTGVIVKRLKDDFLADPGIRSRLKREFEITKSLADVNGVIRVFDYSEAECSYTMEEAESTLRKHINENKLEEPEKVSLIEAILPIMGSVHGRGIIHRDISPTNILMVSGEIKVADFGLGKDLGVFHTHNTLHTRALGQYQYCAPEQFMMLSEGDKRSDVFSLGRLINFVLTGDPTDYSHFLRAVTEKATSKNPAFRYNDANELYENFARSIRNHEKGIELAVIKEKIRSHMLDAEVEAYLYAVPGEALCVEISNRGSGMQRLLQRFVCENDERALYVFQLIEGNYRTVCRTWTDWDPFAEIAAHVLQDARIGFVAKELAARILRYIAYNINRFNARDLILQALEHGIDPLLEETLNGAGG